MTWVQTWSGHAVSFIDPDPRSICLEDIAHALAYQARFNGHTSVFYSVAQHSVLVSEHVSPEAQPWALLHDAAEAYTGDIVRPLKALLGDELRVIETRLNAVIRERFGVPAHPLHVDEVRAADLRALVTERRDLIGGEVADWGIDAEPFEGTVRPLLPGHAEDSFLSAARRRGIR